jgi:hypothetical protein
MTRKLLLAALLLVCAAWLAWGLRVRAARAPRPPPPPGELRGAWHVHTTRSDGRGTLAEVVAAARDAGLQFVVVSDHEALTPEEEGWHGGVLVVEATEVSTPFGHVVALGVPRALTTTERDAEPLQVVRALGGQAIVAHPLHPKRPFTGWERGPWRGLEIVSNDTSWGDTLSSNAWLRVAQAALLFPFDGGRAVLELQSDPRAELRRFDLESTAARRADPRAPSRVLFCAADAHGYPSYRSAFEAFSMHVPVTPTGDGRADARRIAAALLDGRAVCVLDGVAAASGVRLAPAADGHGLELRLDAPDLSEASFTLVHDGEPVAHRTPAARSGEAVIPFACEGGRCAPGDYRVEGTWGGRPWIFTNPIRIE